MVGFNFCLEKLANISCCHPCSEGYDVTNLISLNPSTRIKGFLTDYFVKPPVFVNIDFICPININGILINSQVGLQKSKIFEVYLEKNNITRLASFSILENNEKNLFLRIHGDIREGPLQQTKYDTFKSSKSTRFVKKVVIKILRTEGSSLPAIGGLEIWGKLPKCTSEWEREFVRSVTFTAKEEERRYVLGSINTINQSPDQINLKEKSIISSDVNFSEFRNIKNKNYEGLSIPEEFLDPITCNIMTVPMLLPCGKIVDISTLERFNEAEEGKGRGPSNPFTFELFTEQKKPVVATALKNRLDKFLLEHCDIEEFKKLPRTLGRKPLNSELSTGSSVCSSSKSNASTSVPATTNKRKNIDDLLEDTLAGLPSFLVPTEVVKLEPLCCFCCSRDTLFKMSCKHTICRQCLTQSKTCENKCNCSVCNRRIDFRSAVRQHI